MWSLFTGFASDVRWSVSFFKQMMAYEMRISDWSSDVCSSDLAVNHDFGEPAGGQERGQTALRVVPRGLHPIEQLNRPEQRAHERVRRLDPVRHVELALCRQIGRAHV